MRSNPGKCRHCSHENADDYLFCENCGKPLKIECPQCGHANAHDFAFCENCGHKFATEPAYVPASEELAQTATPTEPPLKRKQKASSVPAPEEAVPAEAAPAPQVVVVQQEKRGRLPAWLWLVLVLFAAVIFFIIIGPRQPNYQPVASSAGQSGGSGNTSSAGQSGGSGNTSSGGQSSSGSTGNTSSNPQPTNTPRPPDSESNLSPARITVDQDSNCRYGPSSAGFDIRETVFEGETVLIIGIGTGYAEEWFLVEVNGKDCWLWSDLGQTSGSSDWVSVNPPPIPVAEQDEPEQDEPTATNEPAPSVDPCEADYWIESISFLNNRENVEMVLRSNDAFISESDADYVFYDPEIDYSGVAGHCDYINASRIECSHHHMDSGGGGGWSQGQLLQVELFINIVKGENHLSCFDVFVGEVVVP